jgi:hypothetical protein
VSIEWRAYYRFCVSLRQRAARMKSGRHKEDDHLAMRLAGAHIAMLTRQLAVTVHALESERARKKSEAA